MDLSVVIPTYNRAQVLGRTLRALAEQAGGSVGSWQLPVGSSEGTSPRSKAQAPRPSLEPTAYSLQPSPSNLPFCYEVLVVDDGSQDETRQVCRDMAEQFPVPLHYLHQPNQKQGAARNRGARKAQGRWLVFLGDDTVPQPDFLSEHWRSHRQQEEALAVIGYTTWAREYPVTRFMEYIGEQGWQFGFSLIDDPQDVPFNFFYTSNLSLSRRFFLDSRGFDEDFREYGWEDIELSLRLKKRGMRLAYNPHALAFHHHPTSLRSFLKRQHKVGYSAWTFHLKHPEMASFLNTSRLPLYSRRQRLKMALLKWLCLLTEKRKRPDLSRYYPDLLSYHYNLGLIKACDE